MRLLVCGSRNYDNRAKMRLVLSWFDITTLIHGVCKGADQLSEDILRGGLQSLQVDRYPADWKKYGRAAGPIRNKQMLVEGKPDLVLAFHEDITFSKGTLDMVRKANVAGVPIILIDDNLEQGGFRQRSGDVILPSSHQKLREARNHD